jgi:hypothetical protein
MNKISYSPLLKTFSRFCLLVVDVNTRSYYTEKFRVMTSPETMFWLIAINFSQKSPHFSLWAHTSPCELSEREVTSPSNLKVVGALRVLKKNWSRGRVVMTSPVSECDTKNTDLSKLGSYRISDTAQYIYIYNVTLSSRYMFSYHPLWLSTTCGTWANWQRHLSSAEDHTNMSYYVYNLCGIGSQHSNISKGLYRREF